MKTSRTIVGRFASVGAIIAIAGAMLASISPVRASVLINTYTGGSIDGGGFYTGGTSNITTQASNEVTGMVSSSTVNGDGLKAASAPPPPFTTDPPTHSNSNLQMWIGGPQDAAHDSNGVAITDIAHVWIDYDLPFVSNLTSMNIWNYNQAGQASRSINTAYIWYSTVANPTIVKAGETGGTAPDRPSGSDWTMLVGPGSGGVFTLTQAPGTSTYNTPDSISFGGVPAAHVFIDIESDDGDSGTTGVSEVQFFGSIPEPASLGLLGVGAIALLKRRRA